MARRAYRNYIGVLIALSGLLLMTGCPATSDPSAPGVLSTTSTDWALFVQQFAREAAAALLF